MRAIYVITFLGCTYCSSLAQAATPQCDGTTTEIQDCLAAESDAADAQLAKYLAAAQARINKDFGSKPDLAPTQAAWVRYRDLECGDEYDFWADGTYKTIASAECHLRLTRQRAREIWQSYLTYKDSTPPLLPEPQ